MKLAEAAADVISKDAAIAAKDLEIAALKRTMATKDTAMTALERESAIMKTKLTDTATETRAAWQQKTYRLPRMSHGAPRSQSTSPSMRG